MLAQGLLPPGAEPASADGSQLGLECAGDAVAVGRGVTSPAVGDRVYAFGHGTLASQPIGKIKPGDRAESADPKAGKHRGPRKVTARLVHHDNDLVDITIRGTDGHDVTLHTTSHHPFWDDTLHTWVPAGKLKSGHVLNTETNHHVRIDAVIARPGAADMYNLTVDQLHTYYVLAGDTPVLVHNSTCTKPSNLPGWRKVDIDMDHVLDRHTAAGKTYNQSGIKTKYPDYMSAGEIEATIRKAYKSSSVAGPSQGDRVFLRGSANGLEIEMWVNKQTRTIETAYPVWR
ncbi:polymorphic toxin-type HINT domain-containing protein [Streptomyces sp. NPDC001816]|uniref:polymorphic toxin-type HINT domain-containing protein n=1 Tax=Streptomyces sp. NPDC001816 TaxID=3364612 RepID=UPI0036B800E7